jgi:hypothetical protein
MRTISRMIELGSFVSSRSGSATFSPTVIEPNSASCWNAVPVRRSRRYRSSSGMS